MKKELIHNAKVMPYTSGDVIDRNLFYSCILGSVVSAAGDLTITVTHSDDGTKFEAVKDTGLFVDKISSDGVLTEYGLAKDDTVNFDIDFTGLKRYVKITASGTATALLAVALGDCSEQPV